MAGQGGTERGGHSGSQTGSRGDGRSGSRAPGDRDVRLIVAHAKNRVIGRDGDMPWRLRDDLRFFREKTTGHTVVMGRKTFESIGKPLPNRTNVVITRDESFEADGVTVVHSPEAALTLPQDGASGPLFVIGGGQIYEALLAFVNTAYITVIDAEPDGDTRFPELGPDWQWTELRRHEADEHNDHPFTIYEVTRQS